MGGLVPTEPWISRHTVEPSGWSVTLADKCGGLGWSEGLQWWVIDLHPLPHGLHHPEQLTWPLETQLPHWGMRFQSVLFTTEFPVLRTWLNKNTSNEWMNLSNGNPSNILPTILLMRWHRILCTEHDRYPGINKQKLLVIIMVFIILLLLHKVIVRGSVSVNYKCKQHFYNNE